MTLDENLKKAAPETLWEEFQSLESQPRFDAVVIHTYCPRDSKLPLRGALVSIMGEVMARKWRCPLILAVGFTVPGESRMECEIYRDFIVNSLGHVGEIILGSDPNARDTLAETREAYRICVERGAQSILVIALKPHLHFRVAGFWRKTNTGNLNVHFLGVPGQLRYHLWECGMFFVNFVLPPGSRRRYWVFDRIGRRR